MKSEQAFWLRREAAARQVANPAAGVCGDVNYDKVATFAQLMGQLIQCTSGHLWVTIENDQEDHVLFPGERLLVPSAGKVIIGGKGGYAI
jgi:hypothetical protein